MVQLAVFLKKVELFRHKLGLNKEEHLRAVWEGLLKLGGSSGIRETGCRVWEQAVAC